MAQKKILCIAVFVSLAVGFAAGYTIPRHVTTSVIPIEPIQNDDDLLFSLKDFFPPPIPIPETVDSMIKFIDTAWFYGGVPEKNYKGMVANYYVQPDRKNRRLLVHAPDINSDIKPMFKLAVYEQSLVDGYWVNDGNAAEWYQDGTCDLHTEKDGKYVGKKYSWYANGVIRSIVEETPIDGKWRSCGWSDSGKLKYQTINVGVETIASKSWDYSNTKPIKHPTETTAPEIKQEKSVSNPVAGGTIAKSDIITRQTQALNRRIPG